MSGSRTPQGRRHRRGSTTPVTRLALLAVVAGLILAQSAATPGQAQPPGDAAVDDEVGSVTVSGRVTDGAGHGWPLYAKVDVPGMPVGTFTDPRTGEYRLALPAGDTYSVRVEPQYPGYAGTTETVAVADSDVTLDAALPVMRCDAAAGYEFSGNVAVLGDFATDPLAAVLARAGISATPVAWGDDLSGYDVVVVNQPGDPGQAAFLQFLADMDLAGTGVVFLDTWTGFSNGVRLLSVHTGNPSERRVGSSQQIPYLYYDVLEEHPVTVGFEVGDEVIHDQHSLNKDHAWFGGYAGEGRRVIANAARADTGAVGSGIGVQERENNRHVLLSMHAASSGVSGAPRFWHDDAVQVFLNAIDWSGTLDCRPVEGGLVVGQITDANTGDRVNGATVTSNGNPEDRGRSTATPDDPARGDGLFWLFSSRTGSQQLTATGAHYAGETRTVDVVADAVGEVDFELAAGQLRVDRAEVAAEVRLGQSAAQTFTVTNTGTASVELELFERPGAFEILGGEATESLGADPADSGAPVQRLDVPVSDLAPAAEPELGQGAEPAQEPEPAQGGPWQEIPPYPFPVMDNIADVWDGMVYSVAGIVSANDRRAEVMRFDPTSDSWEEMAQLSVGRSRPNGAIIDGKFYVVGGWDPDGTIVPELEIYDIASDTWTAGQPIPTAHAASANVVLDGKLYLIGGCQASGCGTTDVWVYDPAADSWSSAAPYPQRSSWTHCGAIEGQIYCAGSSTDAQNATYVYDPVTDDWRNLAPIPMPMWGGVYAAESGRLLVSGGVVGGSVSNQGFAYHPADDRWEPLPNANHAAFRGAGACGFYRIGGSPAGFVPEANNELLPGLDDCLMRGDEPWLEAAPLTTTLQPGADVTVTVSMDSTEVDQPGTYTSGIALRPVTPYRVDPIDVTMSVTPPNDWGMLTGTVTGINCAGDENPLAGAAVQVNSKQQEVALSTDATGSYLYWSAARHNPLNLIVWDEGYHPQDRNVRITPGQTVEENVTLEAICATAGDRQPG